MIANQTRKLGLCALKSSCVLKVAKTKLLTQSMVKLFSVPLSTLRCLGVIK